MGSDFSAEVKLDHEVFYPGNLVTGYVAIKVNNPMKCVGARIVCRGDETCSALRAPETLAFGGGFGAGASHHVHHIQKVNTFLCETLTLFGPKRGSEGFTTIELGHGTYVYPFEFQLPLHIPGTTNVSTFGSGGVNITYHVDAVIQLHAEEFKNFKHTFQVITPVNADVLQAEKVAAPSASGTAKLSSFFHDKGTADFTVKLDRGLYCGGGDRILGSIEVDNTSGQIPVEHVKVQLQCRVDSKVHDSEYGQPTDCVGASWADPIINHKLMNVKIPAGGKGTIALAEPLPQAIHYASYPSTGEHYKIRHVLAVTVEHQEVDLPILIAHSADATNTQQFMPPGDVATKPHTIHECAYDASLHPNSHVIHGVKPDSELPLEKKKTQITAPCPGLAPPTLGDLLKKVARTE